MDASSIEDNSRVDLVANRHSQKSVVGSSLLTISLPLLLLQGFPPTAYVRTTTLVQRLQALTYIYIYVYIYTHVYIQRLNTLTYILICYSRVYSLRTLLLIRVQQLPILYKNLLYLEVNLGAYEPYLKNPQAVQQFYDRVDPCIPTYLHRPARTFLDPYYHLAYPSLTIDSIPLLSYTLGVYSYPLPPIGASPFLPIHDSIDSNYQIF